MAIFEKGEREMTSAGTVIGSNVKLVGALRDSQDILIHGSIEGEVASEKSVTVGETAKVKGPISGTVVVIAGEVTGSVNASERLEIKTGGRLFGDVTAADLTIDSGSTFVGKCEMGNRAEHASKSQPIVREKPTNNDNDEPSPKANGKQRYEVE